MAGNETSILVFFVNGKKVVDENVDPEWTLIYYLRQKLRLCGTKLGCSEGGCGACTVMVSKYDRKNNCPLHFTVNACLTPVCMMHGLAITTVEGIGSVKTKLHPVQERIAKSHGSQCGFCTPGIVMSMYTLLRSHKGVPTVKDLETAFQGNLCRCTGYRPILQGYVEFLEEYERSWMTNGSVCSLGKLCCKNSGIEQNSCKITSRSCENGCTFSTPYDPTQEPIFPPELAVSDKYDKEYLIFHGPRVTWYRPITLNDLIFLKSKHCDAKIVNGNTEIGVEMKFKNCLYPILISPNVIHELLNISIDIHEDKKYVKIGSAVTLSQLEEYLTQLINDEPEWETRIFLEIYNMLQLFAGKQIRNTATVAGNIMTGSPISDLNPTFMSVGCKMLFLSKSSSRFVEMNSNFWTGYRKSIVQPDEVLCNILIPFTTKQQYFKAYKQSKRRDDDIAIVNGAFFLEVEKCTIKKIQMAYGGMAPTTIMPLRTCSALSAHEWNEKLFLNAATNLLNELTLSDDAPGGMVQYRRTLMISLFFKFYLYISDILNKYECGDSLPKSYMSGVYQLQNLTPSGSQYFSKVPSTQEKHDFVGRPIVHLSAYKQATGEAIYCDDMPSFENEVHLSLVLSTKAYARILSIDPAKALSTPGVIDFISAKDIEKGRNLVGPIVHDEEVFASEIVYCHGQVIGAIAAVDRSTARRAAKLVKITYEDLSPVIITIEEAIAHNSYYPGSPAIVKQGDVEKEFKRAEFLLEGQVRIGGQEHFYLETQNTIVNPKIEDDELEIFSSTQHPHDLQILAAQVLGIPSNRIVCRVKRIGGGFGGKETRSCFLGLHVAVAAHKLQRPVRLSLDRDEDMVITGHRHPFLARYKVSFTSRGRITGCLIKLYCNAGSSLDLSDDVMARAMLHCMNAANIPNITCYGYVCKTNLPSNTAFRGFGAPQSMLVGETIIVQIAEKLAMDTNEVHEVNLFKEGDYTYFGEKLTNCNIGKCWEECLLTSDYKNRINLIESFNREHKFRKRGLAVVPTLYGVGFSTAFLEQAGALVLVYVDGAVLISHGGTEMGQGLHTKMIQVASRALEVSVEYIHISETATDKVPNASPTAASVSSDLNGMAVMRACETIKKRLAPIIAKNPKGSWKEWVKEAYFQRISLSACGFYHTPIEPIDPTKTKGKIFNYFTYGTACSEVEIDCLTGDHQVIRTDIVMDVGESLNPAIDIGQIEGAFVQGYGLYTMEELITSPEGVLYSRGPGAYKIPSFADIPSQFNVTLLKGSSNPRAVYSSKAIGEPPLFLSASVFFAIREAIKAYRKDNGLYESFEFNSPATCASIRMSCADHITKLLPESPSPENFKPWNVNL